MGELYLRIVPTTPELTDRQVFRKTAATELHQSAGRAPKTSSFSTNTTAALDPQARPERLQT